MPTSGDAIQDLEDSKKAFEDECAAASGATLLKLLLSIQHIADEVGAQEASLLAASTYVPQTDPFKAVTADAKAFVATMNSIKAAFGALGTVASAIDRILTYIK